jgi:predicted RNA-binding Zn ribbon-like protein
VVNATSAARGQPAPADLEQVRDLLNTWLVPNDTRRSTDRFEDYARERRLRGADRQAVQDLRDDLRRAVEGARDADGLLTAWLRRLGVRARVEGGRIGFDHAAGPAGALFAPVLAALHDGTWPRLKACPDCRWVFYDHTRNASRRWCLMTSAGSGGRSCGTIAKVRRHRARQRATGTD